MSFNEKKFRELDFELLILRCILLKFYLLVGLKELD